MRRRRRHADGKSVVAEQSEHQTGSLAGFKLGLSRCRGPELFGQWNTDGSIRHGRELDRKTGDRRRLVHERILRQRSSLWCRQGVRHPSPGFGDLDGNRRGRAKFLGWWNTDGSIRHGRELDREIGDGWRLVHEWILRQRSSFWCR